MKHRKSRISILIAVMASVIAVFIAKSNDELSDSIIWCVKINNSTFYMAGSIHAGNESVYPLPKIYTNSYKKADKVIFELEDDFETLHKKIFEYAEKDKLAEDQYLDQYLSEECKIGLDQLFDREKLHQYYTHEAWVLNMAIAGTKSKLIGMDPMYAVDKYFHDLAKNDNKEIIGLDKIETQLKLFDFEAPFEMQIEIIEKASNEMEMKAKEEAPLYHAYFDNNIDQFETEFLRPYDFNRPQMKMIYDKVFTQRNISWVETFVRLSTEDPGTYFVLVGSGHYFGPDNVLEILENNGYSVEKI
jgi:uncharacterized protein YbaP (TraB family)